MTNETTNPTQGTNVKTTAPATKPGIFGDLTLDEYERHETGLITYECLQCGRPVRIQTQVEQRQPIAA